VVARGSLSMRDCIWLRNPRLAMQRLPCKLPGQHGDRGCGVNLVPRSDGG